MKSDNAVDSLNRRTLGACVDEYASIVHEGLSSQERAAIASVYERVKNSRILDLGIGAGRTVAGLRELGAHYVGVDYVREMVEHCRSQFPDARFEQMDARSMTAFADGSFDLVFFSCNGISMVDHEGRLAILREVRRVLSENGVFIFSTCNQNSPEYSARFRYPDFHVTANPAKLAVRAVRFVAQTMFRIYNRLRNLKHQVIRPDYAIVNNVCHHYRTMLYFITLENQRRQLRQMGFEGEISIYDLSGKMVEDSRDETIAFVVAKNA